jgi:hypothetical protein
LELNHVTHVCVVVDNQDGWDLIRHV